MKAATVEKIKGVETFGSFKKPKAPRNDLMGKKPAEAAAHAAQLVSNYSN